jgi:hypothetical protein
MFDDDIAQLSLVAGQQPQQHRSDEAETQHLKHNTFACTEDLKASRKSLECSRR